MTGAPGAALIRLVRVPTPTALELAILSELDMFPPLFTLLGTEGVPIRLLGGDAEAAGELAACINCELR